MHTKTCIPTVLYRKDIKQIQQNFCTIIHCVKKCSFNVFLQMVCISRFLFSKEFRQLGMRCCSLSNPWLVREKGTSQESFFLILYDASWGLLRLHNLIKVELLFLMLSLYFIIRLKLYKCWKGSTLSEANNSFVWASYGAFTIWRIAFFL